MGDALGFPLRGVPPDALERLPSLAEDFANRPRGKYAKGQFSDDTQLLLATCEVVYIRDFYGGALRRMNTVFKFYYEAWLLLAIGASAGVCWLLRRLKRLDLLLSRLQKIRTTTLELRVEAQNALNTPQLADPVGDYNSVSFGRIITGGGERRLQLGLRLGF